MRRERLTSCGKRISHGGGKACAQEKLPISKSIVQFQHLSWDILGSGWISGEIRIGKVFFPGYCKRLKPQNLSQILLLLFLYAPKLTIDFIGEGHVQCWSYGLAVRPYCAFVGLDQVLLSVCVWLATFTVFAGKMASYLPFYCCTLQQCLRLKWKLKQVTFEATQSGVLTAVLIDMLSSIPVEAEVLWCTRPHVEELPSGGFGLPIPSGCITFAIDWFRQSNFWLVQMWRLSMKNSLGSSSQAACPYRGFSAWSGGWVYGRSSPSGMWIQLWIEM